MPRKGGAVKSEARYLIRRMRVLRRSEIVARAEKEMEFRDSRVLELLFGCFRYYKANGTHSIQLVSELIGQLRS